MSFCFYAGPFAMAVTAGRGRGGTDRREGVVQPSLSVVGAGASMSGKGCSPEG